MIYFHLCMHICIWEDEKFVGVRRAKQEKIGKCEINKMGMGSCGSGWDVLEGIKNLCAHVFMWMGIEFIKK